MEEDIEQLKSLPYKNYDGPDKTSDNYKAYYATINLSDLIGSARGHIPGENWFECLADCRRMLNFDPGYSLESYKEILLDPDSFDVDYPDVILYEGKYYIDGGGKHRLTIGKCISASEAKVIVNEIIK